MPKLADHEERRRTIVEALWHVMDRDGADAVSVRTVAAEANVSPTTLRHYFPTQDDLLEDAMGRVVDQVATRLRPMLDLDGDEVDVEALLRELLPLDHRRRTEQQTYLAFAARGQSLPRLRAIHDDTNTRIREVVAFALRALAGTGRLNPRRDPELETDRLYALVDGLAFQGALSPHRHPADALTRVLRAHLDELQR